VGKADKEGGHNLGAQVEVALVCDDQSSCETVEEEVEAMMTDRHMARALQEHPYTETWVVTFDAVHKNSQDYAKNQPYHPDAASSP
jgi:hypothetical protein